MCSPEGGRNPTLGHVDVNHNNDHKTGSLGRKVDNFNEMVELGNGLSYHSGK